MMAKYLVFFPNWYELALARDTDEKRLAFYDAIMAYAFEGKVPSRPVKGKSRGREYAAWDAYVATKPMIDAGRDCVMSKADAGRLGGLKRVFNAALDKDEHNSVEEPLRAQGMLPTIQQALAAAALIGVPEWYVQKWHSEMEAVGWVQTNGREVTGRNWRAVLKTWWNNEKKEMSKGQTDGKKSDDETEDLAARLLKGGK